MTMAYPHQPEKRSIYYYLHVGPTASTKTALALNYAAAAISPNRP